MPLSDEQEQLAQIAPRFRCEHELRVKQMEANIAKIQRDTRIEFAKIAVSIFAALVAAFAAGHFTK